MKPERNAKATANDETEWLLELSSNQRNGAFEVQDFIGNLRSMKEKMEAENRELQREWETMKNHRNGGGRKQQQQQDDDDEEEHHEQELPPSSQIPSDEMDGRQERETPRERSESPFGRSGDTWDGNSVENDESLHQTKYSADEASINMLEAQNEKLRRDFQSMKEQFASVETSNQQDLQASRRSWVSESSSSGADDESSSLRSTNKYKTMLHQATQSFTVEHVAPVSSSEKIESDETPAQLHRDRDSESSSVDSSSSSSCSDSATFRSLRSIKYSQTKKSSNSSRKSSDEFHVDLDSLAETSDYNSCQSRSEKDSVDVDGETIEVVFSSKQIEEQRRRRYRDRRSVFDKEDESRSERNSILSGVTSVASSQARPKRSEIRALGREVKALRGLTRKQEQEIEKERQNQGNIIASLKEQMEKVVARECQLRKELAEARDQAHMTESQLYGQKQSKKKRRDGKARSEDQDYWLRQELEASQCQVKRQNQAIAALKRQINGSPDGSAEEKALRLQSALQRVQVVEEENGELRGINQDLLQTKDLLVQVREAMESQLDEHKATQDRLEGQLEESQTRVARLREEVFETRRESDILRRDLEEARKAYEDLGAARQKIEELERDSEVLKAKGEQDRARLLKQSLDNHKAKNVANRQLEEVMARERKREAEFTKNHKELQRTKTTLDERTLRLEEVQLSLSEHQRELSDALERTEVILKENRELRVVNGQMEQVMKVQADEDREALSDLKRQLEEAKAGETLLRQDLDEAKASAAACRTELEESKLESADQVQSLNRQLKSIQGLSKDLEAERTRLYRELRLVNEEAQEHRMKAEKFEKAFIISQQQKSLLETNFSDAVAQLHVAKQVHRQDVRQADDRIWQLEDVLDSQQSTINRWKETARRQAVHGDKACGVPFIKFG